MHANLESALAQSVSRTKRNQKPWAFIGSESYTQTTFPSEQIRSFLEKELSEWTLNLITWQDGRQNLEKINAHLQCVLVHQLKDHWVVDDHAYTFIFELENILKDTKN